MAYTCYKEIEPHYFVLFVNEREVHSDLEIELIDVVELSFQMPFFLLRIRTVMFGTKTALGTWDGKDAYQIWFDNEIYKSDEIEFFDGTKEKWNHNTFCFTRNKYTQSVYDFLAQIVDEKKLVTDDYAGNVFIIKQRVCNTPAICIKVSPLMAKRWPTRVRTIMVKDEIDEYGLKYQIVKTKFLKKTNIEWQYDHVRESALFFGYNKEPYVIFRCLAKNEEWYMTGYKLRIYKLFDFLKLAESGIFSFANEYYKDSIVAFRLCEYYKTYFEKFGYNRLNNKFLKILKCFGYNTYQKPTNETVQVGWSMLICLLIEYESKIKRNGRKSNYKQEYEQSFSMQS